ncbi:MAG TPA: aconitate hydratase, partial [Leptospiraceae bacterium]|nr:aconitate hydratase [Leptospiraceae bacterium]
GRISPNVKANFLASPPLVVAYALAGTVDIDLSKDPIGTGKDGSAIYLKDIWPAQAEVKAAVDAITPEMYRKRYDDVRQANEMWNEIPVSGGAVYKFNEKSTYIQEPPFFIYMPKDPPAQASDIKGARVLAKLGDSVTTDHISPAGNIAASSPAGKYLVENGVTKDDFNSYGARRGNDRVMTRGTFANIRLRNLLIPDSEGNVTRYLPTNEQMSIFDAAMKYKADKTPLVVLAGAEYGTGSSRDWAAKGTYLLGVRAAIAVSYERIHRSNLVGMGVLPLQFLPGQSHESLGLTGEEVFEILGIAQAKPRGKLTVKAGEKSFEVICRLDNPVEIEYYRHGGILQAVLRSFLKGK